jgi:hypothetical protein
MLTANGPKAKLPTFRPAGEIRHDPSLGGEGRVRAVGRIYILGPIDMQLLFGNVSTTVRYRVSCFLP